MAQSESILSTAPDIRIAEPHQSTVAGILRATQQGLFSAAEAEQLIERVRSHVTTVPIPVPITAPVVSPVVSPVGLPVGLPLSVDDGFPATVSGHASDTLLNDPDRTE